MKQLGLIVVLLVCALPASAAKLPILASHDWWPVYSPDDQWIAFTRVGGQGREFALEVVPARGGGRVVQIAKASSQLMPSWSPDSSSLAYQSGGSIYTITRTGGDRRLVATGLFPDWSPDSSTVAFVRDGELHVLTRVLATGVIAKPDWSSRGGELAFARSDGIYSVTLNGVERRLAQTAGEPSAPVWSLDGSQVAYVVAGRVYVVARNGTTAARLVAGPFRSVSAPSWQQLGDGLVYTADGALRFTSLGLTPTTVTGAPAEVGAAYAQGDLGGYVLAYSGFLARCPGHSAIVVGGGPVLSGTCLVAGTRGADVLEGTPREGDVILAGAGNDRVHANDGHTDRVDCGPGHDTVWADRTDRLAHCETVHR